MAVQVPRDGSDYAVVTIADPLSGASSVVTFRVGDDLDGTNPVAIIGGKFKNNDPWILSLKNRISTRRMY